MRLYAVPEVVIPAKAGIHLGAGRLDPSLRRGDDERAVLSLVTRQG